MTNATGPEKGKKRETTDSELDNYIVLDGHFREFYIIGRFYKYSIFRLALAASFVGNTPTCFSFPPGGVM
jgi:hypothetical protein